MEIPGLGEVTQNDEGTLHHKEPIPVSVLSGQPCWFIVENYGNDPNKEEFDTALTNFLSIDPSVLKEVEPDVYRYYEYGNSVWEEDDEEYIVIESPADVWAHIQFGNELYVSRRHYGDRGIYISLECNCDWEEEHGLQIVFKNGLKVNKIGQCDGHLTNSDSYADDSFENVVYRSF